MGDEEASSAPFGLFHLVVSAFHEVVGEDVIGRAVDAEFFAVVTIPPSEILGFPVSSKDLVGRGVDGFLSPGFFRFSGGWPSV